MNKKALEMDMQTVMQGLEEFATFMSFQSQYDGVRILSIESIEEAQRRDEAIQSNTNIIDFDFVRRSQTYKPNSLSKTLSFSDKDCEKKART